MGKGRVWTGLSESMDWVKGEYGLGKARVWNSVEARVWMGW